MAKSSRQRSKSTRARSSPSLDAAATIAHGGRLGNWGVRSAMLATLLVAVWPRVRFFGQCVHDDAYISFRYGRNLVRGDGLVMNAGERVEGFTNFLWTVVSAPVIGLGADPGVVFQLLGTVASLLLVLAVYAFSVRRFGGGWFVLVAPVFLAGNLAFAMESLSGLETMAFALLVFLSYAAFVDERSDSRRRPGLWAALCAAATLLRPEGGLVFAVLLAYRALGLARGESRGEVVRAVALYVVLVAPLFLFRWLYFESWLPNTFYTKVGYTTAQVDRGWRYTVSTFGFSMTSPLLLLGLMMTVIALLWPLVKSGPYAEYVQAPTGIRLLRARRRDEALLVALLLSVSYVVYVLLVGGDYEPTLRFHMPVLALWYLLFQEALRTWTMMLQIRRRAARALVMAVAVGTCLGVFAHSENRFRIVLEERKWPRSRYEHHRRLRSVGEWLNANIHADARIAMSSIGALAWYSDRPILDMMGLTDRHIGRRHVLGMGRGAPGHEKGDGAYVLAREPEVILLDQGHLFDHDADLQEVLAGARGLSELEIVRSPELLSKYDLARGRSPVGVVHFFVRRSGI